MAFQFQVICEGVATWVPEDGGSGTQSALTSYHCPMLHTTTVPCPAVPQSVEKTVRPSAGITMEFRWAIVIRGSRKPRLEDLTSSMAELAGWLPSVVTAASANARSGRRQAMMRNKHRILPCPIKMIFRSRIDEFPAQGIKKHTGLKSITPGQGQYYSDKEMISRARRA